MYCLSDLDVYEVISEIAIKKLNNHLIEVYDFYVITHTFIYKEEDNVYRENEIKKRENGGIMFGKTARFNF